MPYYKDAIPEVWEFHFRRCHYNCDTFDRTWDGPFHGVSKYTPRCQWVSQGYYDSLEQGLLWLAHMAEDIPCGCLFRLYNTHTKEEIVSAVF